MRTKERSKFEITQLLLLPLQLAEYECRYADDFETCYFKYLKFHHENDWKKYRASVDLVEDTDGAILNAFQFQLGDTSLTKRYGEDYLRLYGVLNAMFLQMNAYCTLAKMLSHPDRGEFPTSFRKLDFYFLRNAAGAHTDAYEITLENRDLFPNSRNKTSFRIIQFHLDQTGSQIILQDENNVRKEFNLLNVLSEYETYSRTVLKSLVLHMFSRFFNKKKERVEHVIEFERKFSMLPDYSKLNENINRRTYPR